MERVRTLQHVSLGKKETAFTIIIVRSILFYWERRKLPSLYRYIYLCLFCFIGKEGNCCVHHTVMSVLFHWERRKLPSSPYDYVYSVLLGKKETAIFTI